MVGELVDGTLEEGFEIAIGEETAKREVARGAVGREGAVVRHLGHMVAAHGDVKPKLPVGAHERELVGVALVVEKLGEVGLVPFHVPHMDERYALSEMTRNAFESLKFRVSGFKLRIPVPRSPVPVPRSPFPVPSINLKFAWQKVTAFDGDGQSAYARSYASTLPNMRA